VGVYFWRPEGPPREQRGILCGCGNAACERGGGRPGAGGGGLWIFGVAENGKWVAHFLDRNNNNRSYSGRCGRSLEIFLASKISNPNWEVFLASVPSVPLQMPSQVQTIMVDRVSCPDCFLWRAVCTRELIRTTASASAPHRIHIRRLLNVEKSCRAMPVFCGITGHRSSISLKEKLSLLWIRRGGGTT
jgi:hypothetical protein